MVIKLYYLAGCYTRNPWGLPRWIGTPLNILVAWFAARRLHKLGYHVICPMLNTALMDGTNDYDHFMDGCLETVRRCDGVILLPSWLHSQGAKDEAELTAKLGYPILFFDAVIKGVYDDVTN